MVGSAEADPLARDDRVAARLLTLTVRVAALSYPRTSRRSSANTMTMRALDALLAYRLEVEAETLRFSALTSSWCS